MLQRPTLPALALVFVLGLALSATLFFYSTSSAGVAQRSGNGRAVLYLSYPPTSGTRCVARMRVGFEGKASCCPQGFSMVGVRVPEGEAEVVCLEN